MDTLVHYNKIFRLIACIFLFSQCAHAEVPSDTNLVMATPVIKQKKFDKPTWKKITSGMDFSKEKAEPPPTRSFNFSFLSGLGPLARVIFFSIIILVLGFLLFKLFAGKIIANAKINPISYSIEHPEAELQETDLEALLSEALRTNSFRLAIRIYYLMVLRELSVREMINWKKDKTNSEYIREMSRQLSFNEFRKITIAYERVWYGDSDLQESEYHVLNPMFKNMIEAIRKKEKE